VGLTKDDFTGFPRLCPDFAMELLSLSDSLPKTREKMERWIENGATLGWLIDHYQKKVSFYGSDREAAVVSGKIVLGSGPVEGFTFDLDRLWRCYEI
jgi:Uma2 family endonuclease